MTQSKKVLASIVSEVSLRRLLPPPPYPQTTVRRESGPQLKVVSLSSLAPLLPPPPPLTHLPVG